MEKVKRYAGIGSRETPKEILLLMERLAESMGRNGWLLRSGAADGADAAFERGCDRVGGKKEIFLPWRFFNDHPSGWHHPTTAAKILAEQHIGWWSELNDANQKLHTRNAHQVLGYNLLEPVNCVIYWTENGKLKGGTATALKIARARDIPCFWLSGADVLQDIAREAMKSAK